MKTSLISSAKDQDSGEGCAGTPSWDCLRSALPWQGLFVVLGMEGDSRENDASIHGEAPVSNGDFTTRRSEIQNYSSAKKVETGSWCTRDRYAKKKKPTNPTLGLHYRKENMVSCTFSLNLHESDIKLKIQGQIPQIIAQNFFFFSSWGQKRVRKNPPTVSGTLADQKCDSPPALGRCPVSAQHTWPCVSLKWTGNTAQRHETESSAIGFAFYLLHLSCDLYGEHNLEDCIVPAVRPHILYASMNYFAAFSMLLNHKWGQRTQDESVIKQDFLFHVDFPMLKCFLIAS